MFLAGLLVGAGLMFVVMFITLLYCLGKNDQYHEERAMRKALRQD